MSGRCFSPARSDRTFVDSLYDSDCKAVEVVLPPCHGMLVSLFRQLDGLTLCSWHFLDMLTLLERDFTRRIGEGAKSQKEISVSGS